jgi:hypothetical protein
VCKIFLWRKLCLADLNDLGVGRSVVASGGVFDAITGLFPQCFDVPFRVTEVSDELECVGVNEPNRVLAEIVGESCQWRR